MRADAAKEALTQIFVDLTRELAAEVVHAEAYITEAPYRLRHLEQHFQRVDATLQKHYPDVYKRVQAVMPAAYDDALAKATQFSGMARNVPGELDILTMQQQQMVLESELTAGFERAGTTAKRVVGSMNLGREQRLVLEKAYTRYTLRGGSTDDLAREIFDGLNQTGGFDPAAPWANAVTGKLIQINGRNYNLASYSDLVAQHRVTQLGNAAVVNQAAQDGYDLFQVDDHNTTAEVCKPFEGTIWSKSGTDPNYPALSTCPGSGIDGGPPFHPRCSHMLLPVIGSARTDEERKYRATEATEKMRQKIKTYREQTPPWMNANIVSVEELERIAGGSEVAGSMLKPVLTAMSKPHRDFSTAMAEEPLSETYSNMKKELEKYAARVYVGRLNQDRAKQLGVAGSDLFAMPDVLGHIASHDEVSINSLNNLSATAISGRLYRDKLRGTIVAISPASQKHVYLMAFSRGQIVTYLKRKAKEIKESRYEPI